MEYCRWHNSDPSEYQMMDLLIFIYCFSENGEYVPAQAQQEKVQVTSFIMIKVCFV